MQKKTRTPDWVEGQTIYEVNLRQYTKNGTFAEFKTHLPRLKKLGVGIIWFMPIQPIGEKNRKGSLGSYYSVKNYTAINGEFGTIEEFKNLVQEIHRLGMKVIIDWVANHTAWDHHWTIDHPEFYTKNESGNFKAPVPDWEDVIHLDYGNPNLWDEMINQMIFWLQEADIDGFRCDMAHLVPTLFWNRARRDLDRVKPVFMLAESENHDLLEYAFDTIYNWKLLHSMDELAAGNLTAANLIDGALKELNFIPDGASLLNFTSNHDENSWQGSAIERIHYYLEPLTVLTFLLPGFPLIYSGQEAGNYRRLEFFDKDEIEWKDDKMAILYQKLSHLKKSNSALFSDAQVLKINNDHDDNVCSFEVHNDSKRVLVFLNLSDQPSNFYIECNDYVGDWVNLISGNEESFDCKKLFKLDSYQYKILERK